MTNLERATFNLQQAIANGESEAEINHCIKVLEIVKKMETQKEVKSERKFYFHSAKMIGSFVVGLVANARG